MSYSVSPVLVQEYGNSKTDRVGADVIGTPPAGASRAADLQRQLANAALRNFYTPASDIAATRWGARDRLTATIGVAAASWTVVFSLGATLIR
jgi:hypothetical protein